MFANKLIFNLGSKIYPSDARALLAKVLGDSQRELVSALMNYDPQTGKSKTCFPVVQFAYSPKGFALIGFGEQGQMILQDAKGMIHEALVSVGKRERLAPIISFSEAVLKNTFEPRPYGLTYTVPKMIVEKKIGHARKLQTQEEGKVFLERLFSNSIRRQAQALGMVLPEDFHVEFCGAEGTTAAVFDGSGKKAFKTLKNATFKVNARMTGIWAVGYMLSKGYGHFDANLNLTNNGGAHAISQ